MTTKNRRVYLYDTTLRDGAQTRGIDFTPADKTAIARALDDLGIDYIEGGWPGSNPTDDAFFAGPPKLRRAKLVAFGMTRREGRSASNDETLRPILEAPVAVACLVGKSSRYQVENILKVPLAENRRMIRDSIRLVAAEKDHAFFDAEHFFDGYKQDADFSLSCLEAALEGGAEWLVLCDTNGGTLPDEIQSIVAAVRERLPDAGLGIHLHNDTETAVAGALAALVPGVRQIQGTINGIGERCGNTNLVSVIGSLALKTEWKTGVGGDALKRLSETSRLLDERLNRAPNPAAAYVGDAAFAHKGGLHASAVAKDTRSYEHIAPEQVGNRRQILVSSQAGRANVLARLAEVGLEIKPDTPRLASLVKWIKEREAAGYAYEGADASFLLLARRHLYGEGSPFDLERFRLISERRRNARGELITESEATVMLKVDGAERFTVAIGRHGPVDALNLALRRALLPDFPVIEDMRLTDYKVRILNSGDATEAVTRVLIDWSDGRRVWSTVGLSHNILDASLEAILDAVHWRLAAGTDARRGGKAKSKR
ncbi:MAG: citramalate synthase [Alphaproteobacteria bacterium]|nr:citramalate synthase [Alphaproteobacteria bacterium]